MSMHNGRGPTKAISDRSPMDRLLVIVVPAISIAPCGGSYRDFTG